MLNGSWKLVIVVCVMGVVGSAPAQASDAGLRKVVKRQEARVVPLAKKRLLKALREFDLGLIQYQTLLDKLNGGESRDSLKQSFVTLNKRIAAAAKNETAALTMLGIRA